MEIHGLPFSENENLVNKMNDVSKKLALPELNSADIIALHRLPAKPDKVPGVLVRFSRQDVRERWFDSRRKLDRSESSVHILENLTKHNKTLLWETKQWARDNHFRFVWHRNGRIFVRRSEGDRVVVVKSLDDLRAIQ